MSNQLTEIQMQLIEESFAAVAPQGEAIVERFYQHLFHDYPEVKPMFTSDPKEQ